MRLEPIWEPGTSPADTEEVSRPWLVHRPDGGWDLLYAGRAGGTWRICRALTDAPEPRGFRPAGPPLEPGPAGSGEDGQVHSPCAVPTGDGGLLVVYAASPAPPDGDPGRTALFSAWIPADVRMAVPTGVAALPVSPGAGQTSARPVLAWQRLGLTLDAGEPGDADAGGCDHPALLRIGSRRWLWYTADDGLGHGARVAAASSVAGAPWLRHGVVLGRGAPGQPDEGGAGAPCVLLGPAGRLELVYTGRGRAGVRVLRARSSDGLSFDRLGPIADAGAREPCLAGGPGNRRWLAAVMGGRLVAGPLPI